MADFAMAAMRTNMRASRTRCTRPLVRRVVRCKAVMPREEGAQAKTEQIEMMSLPAVQGLPIIGMAKYLSDNNMDLSELHGEHGDAFVINFGIVMGGWNLALCDEESCKDVLGANHKRFYSSWPDEFVRLLSPWKRVVEPDEQNEWKKMMLSVLSKDNVMNLQLPLMVEDITKRFRGQAASGEQVSWVTFSRRVAFGVASRTSMGALLSDKDADELFEDFEVVSVDRMMSFGFRDGVPGTPFHRSVQARNRMEAALYPKIMAALEDPQLLEGETSGVARFVQAMRSENNQFVPKDNEDLARYIAAQTFFLMFGGTDTTTQALVRMVVLLHRHPQWFRRLQQEQHRLRAEFGDTLDRKVLSRSAVATAIAQEILRVKAPVASVFRKAARDTTVQGIRIPKGTGVVVNLRTPTMSTGTGTAEFNPAQWLNADEAQAAPNDAGGNIVWGAGPRLCAGQNLATVEMIVCLAILAREVDGFVIPPEKNDHDYMAGPAHPTGFPVTLTPRSL